MTEHRFLSKFAIIFRMIAPHTMGRAAQSRLAILHDMDCKMALRIALGFNILLMLLRVYDLSLERYALYGDEAQYWTWGKALDWGYYSKPPMVAWAIAATTYFFGDSAFAIRLSSPFFHFGTALLIYAIGARYINARAAMWSSITYATLPAVTLSATIISTDPALLFFWALGFYGLLLAEEDNRLRWWLLTGIAAGLGGLSKYNMLFFGASAALYFYWQGMFHTQLKNKKLWLGVLAATIIYIPNFIWNIENGFVSYLHTSDNAEGEGLGINPLQLLEFIGAQFGVFGPVLCVVLGIVLFQKNTRWKAFIIPMLAAIVLISLLSRAHANWAAPIYIAATLWVVSWLIETNRVRWLKISLGLHLIAALLFYNFQPLIKMSGIELTRKSDPFRRLKGQQELGEAAQDLRRKFPNAKMLSEERRVVATLMYYLRKGNTPAKVYKWNLDGKMHDHYDLVTDMNTAKGADFILISRTDNPRKFNPYFDHEQRLKPIAIPITKDYTLTYQVYLLEGFRGY